MAPAAVAVGYDALSGWAHLDSARNRLYSLLRYEETCHARIRHLHHNWPVDQVVVALPSGLMGGPFVVAAYTVGGRSEGKQR